MNRYAVTLGVQYRNEPHPVLNPSQRNPDGYLLVQAENEIEARVKTQAVIGTAYAMIYPEDEVKGSRYHPLGCLGEILHGVYPPDQS